MNKITVYTDGSAIDNGLANSGCGWAFKIIYKGNEKMKSGGDSGKTNNIMEMTSVLEAMRNITDKTIPVDVYSDSKYVIETLNGNFKIKKNVKLWGEILAEKEKFANIQFFWVKGHDKDSHNIDVDRAALNEARKAQDMKKQNVSNELEKCLMNEKEAILIDYIINTTHSCPFDDDSGIDFEKECVGFGKKGCGNCIYRNIYKLNC